MLVLGGAGGVTRAGVWIEDASPGTPERNMAADQALLDAARSPDAPGPTVRIYRWDRPAVSIGRLQDELPVRRLHPALACVRRPTGGRAVLHGDDLTVSVVTRLEWLPPEAGTVLASSQRVLSGVMLALRCCGQEAGFGSESPRTNRGVVDCFAVSAPCDLVDARTGRKLAGSAQRREGGALLQQVSLPGVGLPDAAAFVAALRRTMRDALGVSEWASGGAAGAARFVV